MNVTRRLLSKSVSTVRKASDIPTEAYIPATSLPVPIRRLIQHQLQKLKIPSPSTENVKLANPFVPQWVASPHDPTKSIWMSAPISKRRQKLLVESFPAHVLPPSPVNPVTEQPPIQWEDGTLIEWIGDYSPKKAASTLYSRKFQFKGSLAERAAPKKAKERAARMAGMQKRIADWKRDKADELSKNKPSLPF